MCTYPECANANTHYIRGIDLAERIVTTTAGIGTQAYLRDGLGHWARFDKPWGPLQVDANLYIADSGNNALRYIEGDETRMPTAAPSTVSPTATRAPSTAPSVRGIPMQNTLTSVDTVIHMAGIGFVGVELGAAPDTLYTFRTTATESESSTRRPRRPLSLRAPAPPGATTARYRRLDSTSRGASPSTITTRRKCTSTSPTRAAGKIRRIDFNEKIVDTLAGSGLSGCYDGLHMSVRFQDPSDVAVHRRSASDVDIYIADSTCRRNQAPPRSATRAGSCTTPRARGPLVQPTARSRALGLSSQRLLPCGSAATARALSSARPFVVDNGAGDVRRVDMLTQTVTKIAGYGSNSNTKDGMFPNARFDYPWGIAIDPTRTQDAFFYVTQQHATRDTNFIRSLDTATMQVDSWRASAPTLHCATVQGPRRATDARGRRARHPRVATQALCRR